MNNTKQIIVMRTDLSMRKGKMIAQGAHASLAFITKEMHRGLADIERPQGTIWITEFSEEEELWIKDSFTKICVRVESEFELLQIHGQALEADLTSHLVTDNGLTEFKGIPTNTCCAIGPHYADKVDPITRDLELL